MSFSTDPSLCEACASGIKSFTTTKICAPKKHECGWEIDSDRKRHISIWFRLCHVIMKIRYMIIVRVTIAPAAKANAYGSRICKTRGHDEHGHDAHQGVVLQRVRSDLGYQADKTWEQRNGCSHKNQTTKKTMPCHSESNQHNHLHGGHGKVANDSRNRLHHAAQLPVPVWRGRVARWDRFSCRSWGWVWERVRVGVRASESGSEWVREWEWEWVWVRAVD